MKRLILIALLFLIPFQFAWAGMYCEHEDGKAAMHFGHHAHQHDGKQDGSDSKAKVGQADLDCGACHGVCAMFVAATDPFTVPLGPDYAQARALTYTSHIPDGPRRPDRLPVA